MRSLLGTGTSRLLAAAAAGNGLEDAGRLVEAVRHDDAVGTAYADAVVALLVRVSSLGPDVIRVDAVDVVAKVRRLQLAGLDAGRNEDQALNLELTPVLPRPRLAQLALHIAVGVVRGLRAEYAPHWVLPCIDWQSSQSAQCALGSDLVLVNLAERRHSAAPSKVRSGL